MSSERRQKIIRYGLGIAPNLALYSLPYPDSETAIFFASFFLGVFAAQKPY